ncbi:hypothetical protein [Compostibacter hankyongensis]|uniref:Outer membrane protein beta-barrel domain-containing protein n=1 Tax=Compostibacter hankyongensis TaxID=1007089 RepID=A0ABP8FYC8_9BACT
MQGTYPNRYGSIRRQWLFHRLCISLIVLAAATLSASAQDWQDTTVRKGFDPDRLFVGGNLGLSFGDYTYVNISPMVGYRFNPVLAAGVNVNAQYNTVKYYAGNNMLVEKDRYSLVGLGIFGRVYPIQQLFLHVQPEMNFVFGKIRYYDPDSEEKYHDQVPSLLLGAGYAQPLGGNTAFTLMVLYDVLQREHSPYGNNPIFRGGVNVGF